LSPTIEANPRRFSRNMSEFRRFQTKSESGLYSILGDLKVRFLAQEVVRTPFFDAQDRPVAYLVDCMISDPSYESGVIEVQGSVHHTAHRERKDATKMAHLKTMGWWVETVENEDVSYENIKAILERHRREPLEFP